MCGGLTPPLNDCSSLTDTAPAPVHIPRRLILCCLLTKAPSLSKTLLKQIQLGISRRKTCYVQIFAFALFYYKNNSLVSIYFTTMLLCCFSVFCCWSLGFQSFVFILFLLLLFLFQLCPYIYFPQTHFVSCLKGIATLRARLARLVARHNLQGHKTHRSTCV